MADEWIESALALFREACELPEDERASFLDDATGDDAELRRHVAAMLAADDDRHATMNVGVTDAEAAPIPATIGGHRIVRLIAHGGMGVVYEAEQEQPRRRVAIKVARTAGTTGERARRFELEAQLLARLQHPGIAQIFAAGATNGDVGSQPFFVMEFVDGEALTDYATAHLPTAREKLELMIRVCEAVGFAHEQGVVHRDLKPDNVLAAGGFDAATMRTEAGRVVGTLGYMAPEQLAGKTEGLGPDADVYSLGVMLYQLLTGRLPHDLHGVTLTRALAVVSNTDAPLLGVIRPEYRGDIEAVVAKALEKDERHRYRDAAALQADLERYVRGEPTLARPAGSLRRVTKWSRRNPALATAVLGAFLALSTVVAVLSIMNKEVSAALADYGRLEDLKLLDEAKTKADELWPTRSEQALRLEKWLDTYRRLVEVRQGHRIALARVSTRDWKYDKLDELVNALDEFAGAGGLFEQVQRRRDLAESIEQETVTARGEDWKAAIERIAENYGLTIREQVGLIPLGPDPTSGLEEFLHRETHAGVVPPAGKGERIPIEIGADTGLVFVLIPGGEFRMGAQDVDKDKPNFDADAIDGWEYVAPDPLSMQPFFLSKYEMTVGQWWRFVGWWRFNVQERRTEPGAPAKPVREVSYDECEDIMRKLGLTLPDEEQWEYATRAGTTSPFWTGPDEASLGLPEVAENLAELSTMIAGPAKWWWEKGGATPAPWLDTNSWLRTVTRQGGLAPVGTYRANPFGLFDVGGNVSEWCSVGPRHPTTVNVENPRRGMVRGGNFKRGTFNARSAWRQDASRGTTEDMLGLRPAMAIQ